MSRLQGALHAYPAGSLVSSQMDETDRDFHQQERVTREAEIVLAQQVQRETLCSWSDALKAVASSFPA